VRAVGAPASQTWMCFCTGTNGAFGGDWWRLVVIGGAFW